MSPKYLIYVLFVIAVTTGTSWIKLLGAATRSVGGGSSWSSSSGGYYGGGGGHK